MALEKLDKRQLQMVELAVPFAPKWAQRARKELPFSLSQDMALAIVYYHIVEQVRLYKDKDAGLFFHALKLRIVTLTKETLCYDFFGKKPEGIEIVHIDGIDEELLQCEDEDIEKVLSGLRQSDVVKKAFSALNCQEKMVIFRFYYLDESELSIANLFKVTEGRIAQIKKRAIEKMRGELGVIERKTRNKTGPKPKLTEEDIQAITNSSLKVAALAKIYKVNEKLIRKYKKDGRYKGVK